MLLYVFLVLGAWKGVLGKDDKCDQSWHDACPLPDDWRLPATRADIDRMCPQFLQHLDCVDDHTRSCGSGGDPKEEYRQNFRALTAEACREDSQLHTRIVENVGCLHETVQNDIQACHEFLRQKTAAMLKHINSIAAERGYDEDVYDVDLYSPYSCLVSSLETICLARKSSARCGSDTSDLILDVVRRSGFLDMSCAPANKDRLAEYITLLELELEDKNVLNQILVRE